MAREELDSLLKHAPRYELGAAIKVLQRSGYAWRDIRFEGIRDLHVSRSALIRSIRLEPPPSTLAVVSLNTGLLSAASPLPSYFKQFARRLADPDAFIDFIGFWDALQLSVLAYTTWPELGVGRNGLLAKTYRSRLRCESPIILHWLFRGIFPELGVEVMPAMFRRRGRGARARLGGALDRRLVLGAEFVERSPGFRVRLRAEAAESDAGFDWEQEAESRLGLIASMLRKARKPIEVVLHFERYHHGHQLVGAASARRQLGVRPWLPSDLRDQDGPGEVILRQPWAQPFHRRSFGTVRNELHSSDLASSDRETDRQ